MKHIKVRLAILNFLEFAIWGSYLTSLGSYLFRIGLEENIAWFYAVQGIVSMFMPALIGILADKYIQAQKMLSLCQLLGGVFMGLAGVYAMQAGDAVSFGPLFTLYTLSVAFFMPTIGLTNSVAYSALSKCGLDTVKHFPPIRVFGTVGFICAMLFVNFVPINGIQIQNSYVQLYTSAIFSFIMAIYSLTMPKCETDKNSGKKSVVDALGLKAFTLFKNRQMAIFFIFSMFLGVCLQITNGFANPFIQSFGEIPEYASTWGVHNANAIISISQMSETLCILLIPFFLKRFGIKIVMLMAMFAWVFRFGLFGIGNPGNGVSLLILSMIVYGVAFDFFNVSGSLYVDQKTDTNIRSSAQGMFMMMTNGIGATVGTLAAQAVINHLVYSQPKGMAQAQGWSYAWLIFATYALVIALLFMILFREKKEIPNVSKKEIEGIYENPSDMVDLPKS